MIDEALTDAQRQIVINLAMQELAKNQGDDMALLDIIRKLSGTDTIVVCHRAYPSRVHD